MLKPIIPIAIPRLSLRIIPPVINITPSRINIIPENCTSFNFSIIKEFRFFNKGFKKNNFLDDLSIF